jgi:hypothetical protein
VAPESANSSCTGVILWCGVTEDLDKKEVLIGLLNLTYTFFLLFTSVISPTSHLRGVGALKPGNCA